MRKLLAAVSLFLLCACGTSETNIDQYAQMIQSEGWSVTICHFPPGNVGNAQTITVGHPSVLKAHLKHGDHLGECTCEDLGNCPPECGNEVCEEGENCVLCEEDCGVCPPECGDEECNGEETCKTCPQDCGECPPPPPFCGDQECNGLETCATCPLDCGECEPRCGDEVCHIDEDCETCPEDCGECPPPPPFCGDENCDIGESCETCVEDCGQCPVPPCTENCGGEPDAGVPDAGTPDTPAPQDKFAVAGGCSMTNVGAASTAGAGFLLMCFGAFLFVRQRRILGIIVLILGIGIGHSASGHAFPTQNFKPAPGTADYWQTEDAKLSLPSVKLLWHYENDPLALENLTTGDKATLINHRHTLHILGAYTLYDRVQVGADIPLVLGQWNGDLTGLGASDAEGGIANIRLLVKVLIAKWDHVAVGVGADVGLPTSTVDFVDDAGWTATPKLLLSGYIGPVSLATNAGVRFRDPDSFTPTGVEQVIVEHEFVASLGAKWDVWGNDTVDFAVVADAFAHVPLKGADPRTAPLELISGVKVGLPAGLEVSVGAGAGLTSGVGAPDYRILGGLTWAYEPSPCKLEPKYEIQVVQGPPIVEEVPVGVPVPTINPVYFPFDKSDLTLEAQATLLDDIKTIEWAKSHGMVYEVILLIGRTDKRGSEDYNFDLAKARAESVKAFLLENGFAEDELEIQVDGEREADQETEDELKFQQDRTVIIQLIVQ